MAETAALLSDDVFPDVPLRQWVISFPFPLRYLYFSACVTSPIPAHRDIVYTTPSASANRKGASMSVREVGLEIGGQRLEHDSTGGNFP